MTREVQVVTGINAIVTADEHVEVQARTWAETARSAIDLTCSIEFTENV